LASTARPSLLPAGQLGHRLARQPGLARFAAQEPLVAVDQAPQGFVG
jgi:hypothetical protein